MLRATASSRATFPAAATPHVAGSAALALQAHSAWDPDDVRIALVNTADPTLVSGYTPRSSGSGMVQPFGATTTAVVARGDTGDEGSLSFAAQEFKDDY